MSAGPAPGIDRLRRLLDGAGEVCLSLVRDADGARATWASRAAVPLLGLEPLELATPGRLLSHVHPGDAALVVSALSADQPTTVEYRWRHGGRLDQPWQRLELTVLPSDDPSEADARIRSLDDAELLRDRAQAARRREEAAARELASLQSLRNHVLRSLTHRVRTPLAILRASAETALDPPGELSPQQLHELFERIDRATSTLQDLLTDLLELPNMERAVDLDSPTTTIADLVAEAAQTSLSSEHPLRVDAAPTKINRQLTVLQRCLAHLLDNVQSHTPAGTAAHVLTEERGPWLHVLVSDDGPGLPAHVEDHLFEPFVAGPDEGDAPDPHLGIGLAVVRHLVEGLGGTVEIDSAEGEGTTVVLILPLESVQDVATL